MNVLKAVHDSETNSTTITLDCPLPIDEPQYIKNNNWDIRLFKILTSKNVDGGSVMKVESDNVADFIKTDTIRIWL